MQKHGIGSLKKILALAVALGNAGGAVLEDGKIGLGDVSALFKLSAVVDLFAEIDFSAVLPEASELSAEEMAVLKAELAKLELPQEMIEQKIESLFALACEVYLAISKLVALFKK